MNFNKIFAKNVSYDYIKSKKKPIKLYTLLRASIASIASCSIFFKIYY